jgi:hypothetical protein
VSFLHKNPTNSKPNCIYMHFEMLRNNKPHLNDKKDHQFGVGVILVNCDIVQGMLISKHLQLTILFINEQNRGSIM